MRVLAFAVFGLMLVGAAPQDETVRVERGEIVAVLEAEGVLRAPGAAELKIEMESFSGELVILEVLEHRKPVQKGERLLAVDPEPIRCSLEEARNERDAALAGLERSRNAKDIGDREDRLELERAEAALRDAEKRLKHFDDVEIENMKMEAKLNLQWSEDSVTDNQEELDQLKEMYKSEELTNATAEIVVQRAERALKRAKIRLEIARDDYKWTIEHEHPRQREELVRQVAREELAYERAKSSAETGRKSREADVRRTELSLERQNRRVAELERDLDATMLAAPIAGLLVYGKLEGDSWNTASMMDVLKKGRKVASDRVLVTVVPPKELQLRITLEEKDLFRLREGMSAEVEPLALPGTKYPAKVVSVSALTREARISIAEEIDPRLVPGLKGKVRVVTDRLEAVLRVPVAAVVEEKETAFVTTKDGKKVEVRIGLRSKEWVEIKEGLSEGDEIAAKAKP